MLYGLECLFVTGNVYFSWAQSCVSTLFSAVLPVCFSEVDHNNQRFFIALVNVISSFVKLFAYYVAVMQCSNYFRFIFFALRVGFAVLFLIFRELVFRMSKFQDSRHDCFLYRYHPLTLFLTCILFDCFLFSNERMIVYPSFK